MEPQQLYEQQEKIGSGAFGEVYRVKHVLTGETFAIKKLRLHDDGKLQVIPAAQFQEIEALRQLEHPNVCSKEWIFDPKLTFLVLWQIIKLLDVFPDGAYLSLVFEHMETDLFSDLKPGNLLVDANGILKLSDFGLATVYVGPTKRSYSHQVATRWYRAPELLFGGRHYDSAVDMWGVGAIFAELLHPVPLFPGQNDIDQLYRIIQVLGDPESQWPEAKDLPDYSKVSFPPYQPIPLAQLFPDAHRDAVDLLGKLLALDPKKRISAKQALMHPYFFSGPVHSRFMAVRPIQAGKWKSKDDSATDDTVDQEGDVFLSALGKPLQRDL